MPEEVLTQDLLDELMSSPTIDQFRERHKAPGKDLMAYANELLDEKGLKRSEVISGSGLNETYGYQLFSGERQRPGREVVIQLAIGLRATLLETQRLLKCAGLSELYPKNRRDAILIFCIDHGMDLMAINEELYRLNERTFGE